MSILIPAPHHLTPAARIGRALAVVPSLQPAMKAWARLGFTVSDPFSIDCCNAFDIELDNGGIRFLAPASAGSATVLAARVEDQLIMGAGLIGWTWTFDSVVAARSAIEQHARRRFPCNADGAVSVVVPRALTPGAATVLEPRTSTWAPTHANAATRLQEIVVHAGDVATVASAYAESFGLDARVETVGSASVVHLHGAGDDAPSIRVIGPRVAERGQPVPRLRGVAVASRDLGATAAALDAAKVRRPEPQGGPHSAPTIVLPMPFGGVELAFVGI